MIKKYVKPSRRYYLISIAILVLGISIFTVCILNFINNVKNTSPEVIGPGAQEVVLDKKGKYTIFYETRFVVDNQSYTNSVQNVSLFKYSVKNKSTNETIKIKQNTSNSTFSSGNRAGEAIGNFDIYKPGKYEISIVCNVCDVNNKVALSIQHEFGKTVMSMIGVMFVGIFSLIISIIGFVITFIFIYVKRKRSNLINY
ncbi:MAG: hypothetical protein Q8900_05810 [Bacillota bacterium]|nr:hypothetical protein [Bacillota bacterium]